MHNRVRRDAGGSNAIARNKLARLGADSMVKLIKVWLETHEIEDSQLLSESLVALVDKRGVRNIAAMAVSRWWPSFSREQLAQLDIWSILCNTSTNQWVSSRCLDRDGGHFLMNSDPDDFVKGMCEQFHRLYEIDVRLERNDESAMYICRVQLFEANDGVVINTHKPFYFGITTGHSIVFHSPQTDTHSLLILQAFSRVHSKVLTLQRITRKPTASLFELNLSMGLPSINTTGFGIWSVYAQGGQLEPSPLTEPEDHPLQDVMTQPLLRGQMKRRNDIAMLKFKGSTSGVKRQKEYNMKRMNDRIYGNADGNFEEVTKYDSLLPVRRVNFTYHDTETKTKIRINLSGKDVFGGLHELSDNGFIDAEVVPDWLCGDHGDSSGVIIDNVFTPSPTGGLI
ncbi:unnamed protein product [Kluyveromyces dobzhanskii CBS 2104]|uniref:WGS project CCBQ000000000 data, contig 00102 n=1 Tax=Kluyveromyces dobzhanskii CBS 2104 TaxID=1427455 RepID=A0A0A8L6D8_9SACH|nr:unnamed protein product [Kluyveromyces dobzhanskii CBS 2104]